MNGIKNMETATVLTLKDQVAYQPGQVVSKTLAQNNALSVTLFAFDKGEEIDGVNCVGAPVFDAHGYPVAAIWITGPRERIKNENLDDIGKIVKEFADAISANFADTWKTCRLERLKAGDISAKIYNR